jgi:phage shock protein B
MMDDLTAIIIVSIVILGPIWLTFQFLARGRQTRGLNAQDEATITQLTATAARMEERMHVLEQILDAEVPAWRRTMQAGGGR